MPSRAILFVVAALLLACEDPGPSSQDPAAQVDGPMMMRGSVAERVDQVIADYAGEGPFRGAVLLARGEEVLLAKGYGPARASEDAPADPLIAPYPIGSVTKQITAVIAFMLADEGVLVLDAPAKSYLPDACPDLEASVRELLGHTAGLPAFERSFAFYKGEPNTDAVSRAADVCGRAGRVAPGERFKYQNADYEVLTAILESVTGEAYAALVDRLIAEPLDLDRLAVHEPLVTPEGRPDHFRTSSDGGLEPLTGYRFENYIGAGAIYATAADLHRFDLALMRGELLSADGYEAMTTSRPQYGYPAYGQWVWPWTGPDGVQRTLVQRNGWVGAFATLNLFVPGDETVLIIISTVGADVGTENIWSGRGIAADALAALYAEGDAAEE